MLSKPNYIMLTLFLLLFTNIISACDCPVIQINRISNDLQSDLFEIEVINNSNYKQHIDYNPNLFFEIGEKKIDLVIKKGNSNFIPKHNLNGIIFNDFELTKYSIEPNSIIILDTINIYKIFNIEISEIDLVFLKITNLSDKCVNLYSNPLLFNSDNSRAKLDEKIDNLLSKLIQNKERILKLKHDDLWEDYKSITNLNNQIQASNKIMYSFQNGENNFALTLKINLNNSKRYKDIGTPVKVKGKDDGYLLFFDDVLSIGFVNKLQINAFTSSQNIK